MKERCEQSLLIQQSNNHENPAEFQALDANKDKLASSCSKQRAFLIPIALFLLGAVSLAVYAAASNQRSLLTAQTPEDGEDFSVAKRGDKMKSKIATMRGTDGTMRGTDGPGGSCGPDGICWFPGATGASCTSTCSALGLPCSAAAINRVDTSPELFAVGAYVNAGCTSEAPGQANIAPYVQVDTGGYCFLSTFGASTCNGAAPGFQRMCCCSNNPAACPSVPAS